MFGGFGVTEILIIAAVLLLFFGASRIPELARGIGQGINEFRKTTDELKRENEKEESSTKNQKEPT